MRGQKADTNRKWIKELFLLNKRGQLNWEKWVRCGEYRIENVAGKEYIRPVPESGHIYYDINDLQIKKGSRKPDENYLLQSILNLDTSNNQAILDFVNNFGLLGILQHRYLEPQSIIINDKECYFVPERDGNTLKEVNEVAKIYLLDLDEYINNGYYTIKRTMSEPLDEFKMAVNEFQEIGRFVSAIKRAEEGISGPLRVLLKKNEHFKEYADKDIERILPMVKHYVFLGLIEGNRGINRTVLPFVEGKWQIRWNFDSLLSATYFFLTQDLAGNYWLGECKRCAKLFLSSVGKQEYCTRKCEDAERKARSRKANKGFI